MSPLLLLTLLTAAPVPEDMCARDPIALGCPPPDSDGDGVPDPSDRCIDAPETVNHYQDSDGCPDEIVCTLGTPRWLAPIPFAGRSADVRGRSLRALTDIAAILREYPDVRIEIHGHAHPHEANSLEARQRLSRRRAEAVHALRVHQFGISPRRLEVLVYGDTAPVDTNRTTAGRRRNTRVELRIASTSGPHPAPLWWTPLPWDP